MNGPGVQLVTGTIDDPLGLDPSPVAIEIRSWSLNQTKYRQLWRQMWSESHVILWMVDANDRWQLDEGDDITSRSEFDKMIAEPTVRGKPILVLCNKMDLPKALDLASCHRRMGLPFPVTNEGWSSAAITRDRLLPVVNQYLSAVITIAPLRALIPEYALGSVEDLESGLVRCMPLVAAESGPRYTGHPGTTDQQRAIRSALIAVYMRAGLQYPPPQSTNCILM